MKKIILILIIMMQITYLMANDKSAIRSSIISNEHQIIDGTFDMALEFEVKREMTFSKDLEFELPKGWSATTKSSLSRSSYSSGQIFSVIISVKYPKYNIQYYSQRIRIRQFIESETSGNKKGEIQKTTYAKIYFTPYNTIEIWNPADYYDLPRR